MENEMSKITDYILSQQEINMANLQKQFELNYKEMKSLLDNLEKTGAIEYKSNLVFKIVNKSNSDFDSFNYKEDEKFYLDGLWECIKCENADNQFVRQRLNLDLKETQKLICWFIDNDFYDFSTKKILITEVDYFKKYGRREDTKQKIKNRQEFMQNWAKNYGSNYLSDENILKRFYMEMDEQIKTIDKNNSDSEQNEDIGELNVTFDEDNDDEDDEIDDFFETFLAEIDDNDLDEDFGDFFSLKNLVSLLMTMNIIDGNNKMQECLIQIDSEINLHFKVNKITDKIKITDGGRTILDNEELLKKANRILKDFNEVILDGNKLTVIIEHKDNVLRAMMTLYAAILAVRKLKNKQ